MRKAIVIGGTSGIGRAFGELLLKNNYRVGLAGLERDNLTTLQRDYADLLEIQYFDCITEKSSLKIPELVECLGGLDLLVFSAGIGHLNKNLGFEAENHANKVNVLAFTEVIDWGYRFFERQGRGHLVGITSIAGLFGYGQAPAYNAAKSYQITYLEGLRQKARKSGKSICITDIRAGFVDTDFSKDLKRFWVATPEKAARQILSTISSGSGVGYVTRRWVLIAWLLKSLPGWIRVRL